MKSQPHDHTTANPYEGVALLADPLYRYIQFIGSCLPMNC